MAAYYSSGGRQKLSQALLSNISIALALRKEGTAEVGVSDPFDSLVHLNAPYALMQDPNPPWHYLCQ